MNSNQVGIFFHWLTVSYYYTDQLKEGTGVAGDWAYMPVISAPGYEGFYTQKQLGSLWMVCSNTDDEAKIDAMMKILDGFADPDNWEDLKSGPEGYLWNYDEEGNKIPVEYATDLEALFSYPGNVFATKDAVKADLDESLRLATDEDHAAGIERCKANIEACVGKTIAGDGMPNSVYDEYPDILNRTLYVEYTSKIIAGEYSIDKFDEFVEKWYASGGEEVTRKAREWYENMQ